MVLLFLNNCTAEAADELFVLFADSGSDPGERESEAQAETGGWCGAGER